MLYTVRTPKELENDDYSYRKALCLGDKELHRDGGEPEDNTFGRDWGWVPGLLNKERRRWIELQGALKEYLDEAEKYATLDEFEIAEMRNLFVSRFDAEKE